MLLSIFMSLHGDIYGQVISSIILTVHWKKIQKNSEVLKCYKILIFNTFKKNIYLNFDWPNLWWRKSRNLVSAVGDGADVIKSLSYMRTATRIWHLIVRSDVKCNFHFHVPSDITWLWRYILSKPCSMLFFLPMVIKFRERFNFLNQFIYI